MMVVVLGFHRCGTSLLSRCLVDNGFDIGSSKNTDRDWQNPYGYFENDSFYNLHENLLKHNGCDWNSANSLDMSWENYHISEYRSIIRQEFISSKRLIKDPRLTFFVPFIREVIDDLKIIFCTRNKNEACQSLSKAQLLSLKDCSDLYDISHEAITKDMLVVDYHDIVHNHDATMKTVAKFCEFDYTSTAKNVDLKLYRERL